MPANKSVLCRGGCGCMTQTNSGICHDCDEQVQRKVTLVFRAAEHGGVVHAVYERWHDGGTIARCGARFVCGKVDDVPAKMLSCQACKVKARGFGKLERDGVR